MKRWLLPASALVLVLIACGAGVKPAPQVTEAGARMPSVSAVVAHRKRLALQEARKLLRAFATPPQARLIRRLPHYGGAMRHVAAGPLAEEVAVHRLWSVREPLKKVIAFVRAHRPHRFDPSGAMWSSRKPHFLTLSSRWPAAAPTRYLDVTALGLPTHTLIRVDAQVVWTYPRSPTERVPSETSEIDVRAPKVSVGVKSPARVARIISWFDALPISPPGIAVPCPLTVGPDITLSFRNAEGDRLARAKLPPSASWICNSIAFSIGGRPQQPLIDRTRRPSFVLRLQQLLGIHLIRTHR
jgi:hypothetical protein